MLATAIAYDLVIGLDRSDKKADLCLIDTATGHYTAQIVGSAGELVPTGETNIEL